MTRKLHRITGLILVAFVLMHMATHLSGLWGIDAYNATQAKLRLVYRNQLVEPLLFLAIAVQVGSGLRLIFTGFRRRWAHKWGRVQTLSALIFLLFILQHMSAMILARWVEGLDTNFYWPASVMNGPPFTYYFVPYYFFGVSALFVHLGCAARLALIRHKQPVATPAFWILAGSGALMAAVIDAMLLGAFYSITLPAEWIAYLQAFVPASGK